MYIIQDSVIYPREPNKIYTSFFKGVTAFAVEFTTRASEAKIFRTKKEALKIVSNLGNRSNRKLTVISALSIADSTLKVN